MPKEKNNSNNCFEIRNKKIPFEDKSNKKMMITIHALKWVLLLIFLFVSFGISTMFLTGGSNYLTLLFGYSIVGFFTFFMGYFGWLIARGAIEMIHGKNNLKCGASYYIAKKPNNKH